MIISQGGKGISGCHFLRYQGRTMFIILKPEKKGSYRKKTWLNQKRGKK